MSSGRLAVLQGSRSRLAKTTSQDCRGMLLSRMETQLSQDNSDSHSEAQSSSLQWQTGLLHSGLIADNA